MDVKKEFNLLERFIDSARSGGQIEFAKRYSSLSEKDIARIPYSYKDLENAFQHAYAAVCYTKNFGETITRRLGYQKEITSQKKEIKNFGSRYHAYLDTNRDLWNNEAGIKYAINGKKQGKKIDEIADDIFNNIIKKDSDFIVDYKNDKNNKENEKSDWKKRFNIGDPNKDKGHWITMNGSHIFIKDKKDS